MAVSLYKIQPLVSEGYPFGEIFPDKQDYLRKSVGYDFGIEEIVKMLQRQTNNFTEQNAIALDLDSAVYKLVDEWKEEQGEVEVETPEPTAEEQEMMEAVEALYDTINDLDDDDQDEAADAIEAMLEALEESGFAWDKESAQFVVKMAKGGGVKEFDDSLIRVLSKKANEMNSDDFSHYYAQTILLQGGNRQAHRDLIKSLELKSDADIGEIQKKLMAKKLAQGGTADKGTLLQKYDRIGDVPDDYTLIQNPIEAQDIVVGLAPEMEQAREFIGGAFVKYAPDGTTYKEVYVYEGEVPDTNKHVWRVYPNNLYMEEGGEVHRTRRFTKSDYTRLVEYPHKFYAEGSGDEWDIKEENTEKLVGKWYPQKERLAIVGKIDGNPLTEWLRENSFLSSYEMAQGGEVGSRVGFLTSITPLRHVEGKVKSKENYMYTVQGDDGNTYRIASDKVWYAKQGGAADSEYKRFNDLFMKGYENINKELQGKDEKKVMLIDVYADDIIKSGGLHKNELGEFKELNKRMDEVFHANKGGEIKVFDDVSGNVAYVPTSKKGVFMVEWQGRPTKENVFITKNFHLVAEDAPVHREVHLKLLNYLQEHPVAAAEGMVVNGIGVGSHVRHIKGPSEGEGVVYEIGRDGRMRLRDAWGNESKKWFNPQAFKIVPAPKMKHGGEIDGLYDLRISLGKYGRYPMDDAMASVIRDVFLAHKGRIDKGKWDKTIAAASKHNPAWKGAWNEFKEFSEITVENGEYHNPYQMGKGGDIEEYYSAEYYATIGEHGQVGSWPDFNTAYVKAMELYEREKADGTLDETEYIGVSGSGDRFAIIHITEPYMNKANASWFNTQEAFDTWDKIAEKAFETKEPQEGKYPVTKAHIGATAREGKIKVGG